MTAGQVRDLLRDLLEWRRAQGADDSAGGQIRDIIPDGSLLTVTFADGDTALIRTTILRGQDGGQE